MADQAPVSETPPPSHAEARIDSPAEGRLRRSPRYGAFLLLGAALGVLTALVLTLVFDSSEKVADNGAVYSQGQVFGFLALAGIAVGLVVGGLVALVLERAVGRRTRTVHLDHESVESLD